MQDQNMTQDPVLLLKEGGYSDVEVRETLQPLLKKEVSQIRKSTLISSAMSLHLSWIPSNTACKVP